MLEALELPRVTRGCVNANEIARAERGFNLRQAEHEHEPHKQEARDRVLSHILGHHDREHPVRFLGLPGEYWEFEKQLLERVPGSRFLGFEWNYRTWHRATLNMPGPRQRRYTEQLEIGDVTYASNGTAHLMYCHLGSFVSLRKTERKKSRPDQRRFTALYKANSAAWLDFTSPSCAEVEQSLSRISNYVAAWIDVVPIAITLMIGRDTVDLLSVDDDTLNRRTQWVASCINRSIWRRYVHVDSWSYKSAGGCTMGLFTGLLTRSPEANQP